MSNKCILATAIRSEADTKTIVYFCVSKQVDANTYYVKHIDAKTRGVHGRNAKRLVPTAFVLRKSISTGAAMFGVNGVGDKPFGANGVDAKTCAAKSVDVKMCGVNGVDAKTFQQC